MTTTPESHPEPTAAQLIAIALGTAPPVPAEPTAPGDTGAVLTETTPTAPPPIPA